MLKQLQGNKCNKKKDKIQAKIRKNKNAYNKTV